MKQPRGLRPSEVHPDPVAAICRWGGYTLLVFGRDFRSSTPVCRVGPSSALRAGLTAAYLTSTTRTPPRQMLYLGASIGLVGSPRVGQGHGQSMYDWYTTVVVMDERVADTFSPDAVRSRSCALRLLDRVPSARRNVPRG